RRPRPNETSPAEPDACVQRVHRDSTTTPITSSVREVRRPRALWMRIDDDALALPWMHELRGANVEVHRLGPGDDAPPADAKNPLVLLDADASVGRLTGSPLAVREDARSRPEADAEEGTT